MCLDCGSSASLLPLRTRADRLIAGLCPAPFHTALLLQRRQGSVVFVLFNRGFCRFSNHHWQPLKLRQSCGNECKPARGKEIHV